MFWKFKGRRRRAFYFIAEFFSEQGVSEADIDSDSGYCSFKYSNNQFVVGVLRNFDFSIMSVCNIVLIYQLFMLIFVFFVEV